MLYKVFFLHFLRVSCIEFEDFDQSFLNLRRRETIPLHEIHNVRRLNIGDDDLNYRKTFDIRDELDRKFEISESQMKNFERNTKVNQGSPELKDRLEKLQRELNWLTINTDEGIGIGI